MKIIKINNKKIGDGYKCFFVAEISANHGGSLNELKKLILECNRAGADAIKIQLYQADTITIDCGKKDFLIKKNSEWNKHKTLYDLYKVAETPFSWAENIFNFCKKKKILIFASVFDASSVKLLEKINCPAYKIASPEITDHILLEMVAKTKKPVIISNGLCNYKELREAVELVRRFNKKIVLLKCTSAYPSSVEDLNLATIAHMKRSFKIPVGFSDHTIGTEITKFAASIGSNMIEKHVIRNSRINSVDSFFSITTAQLTKVIREIRSNEISLGNINYNIPRNAKKNISGRKSLYPVINLKKGDKVTHNNIKPIRPSYSLHPKFFKKILGKKLKKNISKGQRLRLRDFE
jgi:pseudaminic acid synthase